MKFLVLILCLGLISCQNKDENTPSLEKKATTKVEPCSRQGKIRIMNGTNINGAAGRLEEHLREQGFCQTKLVYDRPEAPYKNSMILVHDPDWGEITHLVQAIRIQKLLQLQNTQFIADDHSATYAATIIVGRDIEEIQP